MSTSTFPAKPVVLLTNDDGPPGPSSPNIYSFVKLLQETLGWDVRVVIPDCQKSWVGKAYAISDVIEGKYFYPLGPDGLEGEITSTRRPLRDGEFMEWVLLSGTPATCANIGLHNLYPGEIDLVLSGPNHGRNSSSAFTLSSGTIGATLSSALSAYPSIAISYGVVTRPVSAKVTHLANEAAIEVVARLWADWGIDGSESAPWKWAAEGEGESTKQAEKMRGKVQLYNVNLALVEDFLIKENRKTVWTKIARNGYGSLFKSKPSDPKENRWDSNPSKLPFNNGENSTIPDPARSGINAPQTQPSSDDSTRPAGPSALPTPVQSKPSSPQAQIKSLILQPIPNETKPPPSQDDAPRFYFAPEMKRLIFPAEDTLIEGTDSWALFHGAISVTPLQASFAEGPDESMRFGSQSTSPQQQAGKLKGQW